MSKFHHVSVQEKSRPVGVAECCLLGSTVFVSYAIIGFHPFNGSLRVLNDLAVLNVDTSDLSESTGCSVVCSDELRDNGNQFAGVDSL